MNLRKLALTVCCLVAFDAGASAGLTNAGVDPQPQPAGSDEPTLAQVAPAAGTNTQPVPSIAGNPIPGGIATTAAGGAATAAGSTSTAAAAAKPTVTTPPPPPDPATLPVSVIRPLNKAAPDPAAGTAQPMPANAPAEADSSAPRAPAREPRAPANPVKSATTVGATTTPATSSRVGTTVAAPRSDASVRTTPETPSDDSADSGSGSFIFYTGIGIAAVIVLLAVAAFMRSKEDGGSPRAP